jgi:hypothetical protein
MLTRPTIPQFCFVPTRANKQAFRSKREADFAFIHLA